MTAGEGSGKWVGEKILRALDARTDPAAPVDLANDVGINRKSASSTARVLLKRGLVNRETGRYFITDLGRKFLVGEGQVRGGPQGPQAARVAKSGTVIARAWGAIRRARKFTAAEIAGVILTDEEKAEDKRYERIGVSIGRYCKALADAGFLARMTRREAGTALTSTGFLRFSLIRDTGPKVPVHRRKRGEVFDPNTGEAHSCRG